MQGNGLGVRGRKINFDCGRNWLPKST